MDANPTASRSAREHGQHHLHQHQQRPWSCSFSFPASFSWPPQRPPPSSSSYTCGYCRREFRSAQALGGHMNVHRRERARLRQCPNPSRPCHGRAHPLPNLNFSPPPPQQQQQQYCPGDRPAVMYSFFSTTMAATRVLEVDLELGVGVCSDGGGGGGMEEGLDLELRLGCS
ncbi:hypothetical protein E2562_004476 [Oryza meyeriana var. granulata]|uniref:C2H2-type domain-containing protein n=1 Tax=Oryza meyeriana var. granulata TaxID=110450 RepID=A0A6G1F342_9ORYZ|nr:hypothetical protein E2562_004476 [Oryza meyeriana var. granulata]